jgi:hypothetical protein
MSDDLLPEQQPEDPGSATSRRALMLGAVGASAVVSIRPALAQAAGSVLLCEIKVPDQARAGSWVAADGKLVPAGTKGAFPPAVRAFKGEEVKRALAGTTLPGTDAERSQAYVNYIRRLQRGQGGFTCFASLQSPR